jgi:tetratricopeptide (TPR) repeat protein
MTGQSLATSPTRRRWWFWPLAILLPAAVFAAVAWWQGGSAPAVPTDLPAPFPSPEESWQAELTAVDASIVRYRSRAAQEPTDWLSPEGEMAAWLDRAQMTARWQDMVEAEGALLRARNRYPAAMTPWAASARLAMALHNNSDVEPALAGMADDLTAREPSVQADALAMRGDLALYAGDWQRADRLYAQAQTLNNDAGIIMRRAFLVERTQGPAESRPLWLTAATRAYRPSRRLLSTLAIRLGNGALASGEWDAAAGWYARAERYLPGDWHAIVLVLQMRAMTGDLAGAIASLTPLAEARDIPELWDALAAWKRAAGDTAGADAAATRASAGWAAWPPQLTLASRAHLAEHALLMGDKEGALAAAEANYRNRPYGDAATLLAAALSANGDVAGARALITRTVASGWRSVETDRLGFELAALSGDSAAAERLRDEALARNTRTFDPAMTLARFGLH